ncbi:hypothetical protein SCP_0400910 [Sparassis crispa]|uniref:Uncharacterized protein n=1 Tax=Sparassis crispa TaxID=139825 RepID=A0A401GHQ0_9APHY|nr:hypothetical protein SCP_0400910 [Sparassis crispa]GBE81720.1 hypothetical protein SCP_0400910 [Sparassis crispa]
MKSGSSTGAKKANKSSPVPPADPISDKLSCPRSVQGSYSSHQARTRTNNISSQVMSFWPALHKAKSEVVKWTRQCAALDFGEVVAGASVGREAAAEEAG